VKLSDLAARWRLSAQEQQQAAAAVSDYQLAGIAQGLDEAAGELEDFIRHHQGDVIE